MTTRRLRDAAVATGIVFLISFAVAALIGQHNDGPLGDLPEWLGSTSYVIWLASGLVLVLLGLAAIALWFRRGRQRTTLH